MPRLFELLFPTRARGSAPKAGAGVVAPAPPTPAPMPARPIRMLSLASATRDYARSVESGTFDRLRSPDLARFFDAMGPDLWAFQYARRLTSQSAWRARPEGDEAVERALAARAMLDDIETWIRALKVLDRRIALARLKGEPIPEALAVPAAIRDVLEARDAAALARIGRRRGRGGEDETDPAALPDEAVHHPPFPGRPA